MNPELKSKVIADLTKSGFGSELVAISRFQKAGWRIAGSPAYYDKDEDKTRTSDFYATIGFEHKISEAENIQKVLAASIHIVGEVKKSDYPWVVFRHSNEMGERLLSDGWLNPIKCSNSPVPGPVMASSIGQDGLFEKMGWHGYQVHQPFRNSERSVQPHAAFLSVAKAAESCYEGVGIPEKEQLKYRYDDRYSSIFDLVKPLIVLDGVLLLADFEGAGDFAVSETPWAPFCYRYNSKHYRRSFYNVDVVTVGQLDSYINLCRQRIERIFGEQVSWISRKWPEPFQDKPRRKKTKKKPK